MTRPFPAAVLLTLSIGLAGRCVAADRADGPVDAASSDPIPNLVPFANPDGSLDIVWRQVNGKLKYSRFSGPDWKGTTRDVPEALGLLGGFTKDERGNAYILTGKKENLELKDANGNIRDPDLRRPGVLKLQRIPAGGAPDLTLNLNQPKYYVSWGIYNPITHGGGSSARLAYGGGSIAATFGHNIPGSDNAMHLTGALLAVDTEGKSTYNEGAGHHTAGNQVWYVGDSFVKLQEGDQGILMSRLIRKDGGGWSWSADKLVYRYLPADPDNDAEDTLEYARCGNVVDAGDRYMFVFSGKRGEGSVYFGRDEEVPGVKGATLSLVFVPKAGFENLPTFEWPKNPVGEGIEIRQLAKPPGTSNLVRPRIIDTKDGQFTVVYEQWSDKQKYELTRAVRIDRTGLIKLAVQTPLAGNPRCQHNAEAFLIGNECGWVAGDNANRKIVLHLLEGIEKVRSFSLNLD